MPPGLVLLPSVSPLFLASFLPADLFLPPGVQPPLVELLTWLIAGLLFGSFANACIHRWPREMSVMRGRSHCPHCDHLIAWHDNLPVVSWLMLLGRCRSCRGPISMRYPGIELLAGCGFLLARLMFPTATAAAAAAFFWALVVAFWVDYDHRIIPDEISYPFTLAGLALAWWVSLAGEDPFGATLLSWPLPDRAADLTGLPAFLRALAGAVTGGALLGGLRWLGEKVYHQEAMGLGDVKLLACIGAWTGVTGALYSLFAASILGAAFSLVLIAKRRGEGHDTRTVLKSAIPFGPFLALGALFVVAWERVGG